MQRIGDILVEQEACSPDQIEGALRNQVILGGRLGTNLIELGYVDEAALAAALARQYSLSALHGAQVTPTPEALALLRPFDVDRLDVIPYRVDQRQLMVLCVNPRNLATLDEVGFRTGHEPVPVVVPEIRFWQLLWAHYRIHRGLRGLAMGAGEQPVDANKAQDGVLPRTLSDDLMSEDAFEQLYQNGASRQVHSEPAAAAPEEPEWSPFDDEVITGGAFDEVEQHSDVLPVIVGRALDEGVEEAPAAKTWSETSPCSYPDALRLLADAQDRDAIAHSVLRYASSKLKRAMLFTVHNDWLIGWDAIGAGVDLGVFRRLMIPLAQPSVFQLVVTSCSHYLGSLARVPVNVRFLGAMGRQIPRSALVLPVLVNGRVVNVFYGDDGHDAHCTNDIAELLILALKIGASYESIFLDRLD